MLIHKRTLGVLSHVWNKDGTALVSAYFSSTKHYGLNPDEWWELRNKSSLALSILIYYPNFIPLTDDAGNLIGISLPKKSKQDPLAKDRDTSLDAFRDALLKRQGEAK